MHKLIVPLRQNSKLAQGLVDVIVPGPDSIGPTVFPATERLKLAEGTPAPVLSVALLRITRLPGKGMSMPRALPRQ